MDNIIFKKMVYYINDEDYLCIQVTKENNGFFIWFVSDQNDVSDSIIDYDLFDKDGIIEKAVDISRLDPIEIKDLIMKRVSILNKF